MSGEEGQGWKEAVHYKEDGGEGVNADVEVGEALEELEAAGGQEGVVSGEENLDRACGPTENLVESVGEVDGCRATESIPLCNAVD